MIYQKFQGWILSGCTSDHKFFYESLIFISFSWIFKKAQECAMWLIHFLSSPVTLPLDPLMPTILQKVHNKTNVDPDQTLQKRVPNDELPWLHDIVTYEPPCDKINKVSVRPAKTQTSLASAQSGCPDWTESSLGAQPHCWFCHEAAHMSEPCHEKTCFCHMRTTKMQFSLRRRAVW